MNDPGGFARFVPGFDFLQSLAKSATQAMPGGSAFSQWIAPTLDPAELDKRIGELRTVQMWLEQNARLLQATIQALEVQRMTLATLRSMNVPLAEAARAPSFRAAASPSASAFSPPPAGAGAGAARRPAAAADAAPAVDPMQWWGALTQQFTELATQALKDGAARVEAGAAMAGAPPAGAPSGSAPASSSSSAKPAARTAPAAPTAPSPPAAKAAAKTRRRKASPRRKAAAGAP